MYFWFFTILSLNPIDSSCFHELGSSSHTFSHLSVLVFTFTTPSHFSKFKQMLCHCFIGNYPIPWRFYSDPPESIITLAKVLFLSPAHAFSRPSSLDETVGLGVLSPGLCYPIYSCNSSTEVCARQFSIKVMTCKCWAWWLRSTRLS